MTKAKTAAVAGASTAAIVAATIELDIVALALGIDTDASADVVIDMIGALRSDLEAAQVEAGKVGPLQAALDAAKPKLDEYDEAIAALSDVMALQAKTKEDLDAAIAARDAQNELADGDVVSADDHQAVVAERDKLKAQLDKAKGEVKVLKGFAPAKPRKVGPCPKPDDLLEQLLEGPVDLVFSNGKLELAGVDPIRIEGEAAWAKHGEGLLLKQRLEVPGLPKGSVEIVGVGAFVDGKQIAWCQLHEPIPIAAGHTAGLRDSIIF